LDNKDFCEASQVMDNGLAAFGRFLHKSPGNALFSGLLSYHAQDDVYYEGDPFGHFYLPVFQTFNETNHKVVAVIVLLFQWASYFKNILSQTDHGIVLVLDNLCDGPFTYLVNGKDVAFLGKGDLHDSDFKYLELRTSFGDIRMLGERKEFHVEFQNDYCPVSFRMYPSRVYFDAHISNMPIIMACVVLSVFAFTVFMFLSYDRLVERRQELILMKAKQSTAVVTSLFPKNVANRLMEQIDTTNFGSGGKNMSSNKRLKSFLVGNGDNIDSQPIADLFPSSTVLFADIVSFTAWSSTREPRQVFILLQTIYQAFDELAHHRKVFKVETIGDSYVAVTGVPDPQQNHALIMARFATECHQKIVQVTADLGLTLGPGTSELRMRFGIHSGPVTAGVLRGDRARFQLFGDTVNTASRMER
jgi:Adenylate and Guanylate cyclase catalytic domain